MTDIVTPVAQWCAATLELIGVSLIVALASYALLTAGIATVRKAKAEEVYEQTRHRLGRGILLGLEFLVAADIVHTAAVELTFTTVAVLAIIVLIRTFLSFTLEVELTGRWPWQGGNRKEEEF